MVDLLPISTGNYHLGSRIRTMTLIGLWFHQGIHRIDLTSIFLVRNIRSMHVLSVKFLLDVRSRANNFNAAANNSDQLCYNFMPPRSSSPLRYLFARSNQDIAIRICRIYNIKVCFD